MRHLTEEQLILYQYGEAEDSVAIATHLQRCPTCRHSYESLSQALGSVTDAAVPERGPEYGTAVWQRLSPCLRPHGSKWAMLKGAFERMAWRPKSEQAEATFRFSFRVAGWCVSVVVLLLAGLLPILRFWPSADTGSSDLSPAQERIVASGTIRSDELLFKELGDHLERSQLALVEIITGKSSGPVDISIEQVLARELMDANRHLCRTAAQQHDGAVMSTLEELERTLLEISNSPPRLSSEQFAELRRRLGPDAVVCKMAVVGAQLRARQAAQALTPDRS